MKKKTVSQWGFIGCGNLSQSIITGVIALKILKPSQISATNRSQSKLKKFAGVQKIRSLDSNKTLMGKCRIIVLGTKPQDLVGVLEEISPHIRSHHLVISLAAGVTSSILKKYLNEARAVFRVMANIPAAIQMGLFGLLMIQGHKRDLREVSQVFENLGTVVHLNSDKEVNALAAGSASGTGFIIYFMEAFADWFYAKGFSRLISKKIAVETFVGSSALTKKISEKTLSELRKLVTSKKGTTFAGLKAMRKLKIRQSLQTGLQAAYIRSEQIAKALPQKAK